MNNIRDSPLCIYNTDIRLNLIAHDVNKHTRKEEK